MRGRYQRQCCGNAKARMEVSVDGSVGGNVEAIPGSVVIRGSVGGDVISGPWMRAR